MLAGAEAGEAVGLVGGPVGMAVGAAAGTLLGATIGLGTAAYQDIVGKKENDDVNDNDNVTVSPARQEQLKVEAERAEIEKEKAPYVKDVTAEAKKWDMDGYLPNLITRRSNLYKAVKYFKFMNATPEIGTNVSDRELWYYSHKKPYLNDPEFQKLHSNNTGYVLAEQEQIQYILNNFDIYKDNQKTVDGFPKDTLFSLDKKRLGVREDLPPDVNTSGSDNENENVNDNVNDDISVPV